MIIITAVSTRHSPLKVLIVFFGFTIGIVSQLHAQEGLWISTNEPSGKPNIVGEITTVVCPFKQSVDYDEGRVKCGFITVPENREKEDSRSIRLLFTHIVAEGRLKEDDAEDEGEDEELEVREDPIVYLTGGPGVSIEPYVSRFLKHDLTKSRDLYILNQRGIDPTGNLCPFFSSTSRENLTAVTLEESEIENAQRTKACFDAASASGVDLSGYNTVENAKDVRALRLALGFESWNVWGISYGSHLGQMLTQFDSEGIRALVLDAIVPNDLGDLMRIHRWVSRNHDLIFAECERQGAEICDGLRERYIAAYNSIVDEPIIVDALDEELYPSGKYSVPALIVGFAPFSMQYEQDEHPAIPAVMLALTQYAEERDENRFQAFTLDDDGESIVSPGMSNAIRCNDGYVAETAKIAAEDLKEIDFIAGVFSVEGAIRMAKVCEDAGLPPRDRSHYQLVNTDIPTLIVNGDWDPITPPPLAERIAPGFSNGRLIIVPYAGHGPTRSMSECSTQVMNDFFDAPNQDLTTLDASCLEKGADAPEFLDYLYTDAALKLAAKAGDDPKKLIFPGAVVTITVLTVISGFFAILSGYTVRRFTSSPSLPHGIGPVHPRFFGFVTALLSIGGLALIGTGVGLTIKISELSIVAGIAPPAYIGAWLLLISVFTGAITVYATVRTNKQSALRKRTLIGLPLVSISAIVLALYLMQWGINVW